MTMDPAAAPAEAQPIPHGSLERAVAGECAVPFEAVLSEAWRLVKGSKSVLVGGMALATVVNMAFGGLSVFLAPPGDESASAVLAGVLIQLAGSLITYAITAGLQLYAIRRAAGDPRASFADVTTGLRLALPIFGLYLLQGVLIVLGLVALVIPGIYLAVAYGLALPLLVERGLGIWEALETSRKAITHHWFLVLGLFIVIGLAAGLGALLTLGIALIWLAPWAMLVLAVLYVRLFGYAGRTPA